MRHIGRAPDRRIGLPGKPSIPPWHYGEVRNFITSDDLKAMGTTPWRASE